MGSNEHIKKWEDGNSYLKQSLESIFKTRTMEPIFEAGSNKTVYKVADSDLQKLYELLENNIWFYYLKELYKKKTIRGDNWIDFETEISIIIQWFENKCNDVSQPAIGFLSLMGDVKNSDEKLKEFQNACKRYMGNDYTSTTYTMRTLINSLYEHLEFFIEAFEIYLSKFVETQDVASKDEIKSINPDYVISFNYTHTYQRLYNDKIKICYIHGECRRNLSEKRNNMVLGIDEYLPERERDTKTDYAIFKKFVQRIRKRNSIEYLEFYNELMEDYKLAQSIKNKAANASYFSNGISDVWVYGHSLDFTDHDVLKLFLEPDATSVHIFAYNKVAEGQLISNLIKIISEKRVIEKATMNPAKIEFFE